MVMCMLRSSHKTKEHYNENWDKILDFINAFINPEQRRCPYLRILPGEISTEINIWLLKLMHLIKTSFRMKNTV